MAQPCSLSPQGRRQGLLSPMSVVPLVDAAWLREHLEADDLVLLDASIDRSVDEDGQTVFGPGHQVVGQHRIKGARHADLFNAFSDPDGEFLFTRPSVEQLAQACVDVGISSASRVVVYDRLTGAYAARVWFVLRAFGFENVSVLDGGFPGWIDGDGATESGPVELALSAGGTDTVAELATRLGEIPGRFVDLDEAIRVSTDPRSGILVCALRHEEYVGDPSRERSGHIPRSLSFPYPATLTADSTVDRGATQIGAVERGIVDQRVVAYCGGGVNAAGLALSFAAAGLEMPAVYDGSLNEWRANPGLPLEVGE